MAGYSTENMLKGASAIAVGASAAETVVSKEFSISEADSKNLQIRIVATAAQEVTGITIKLQHSYADGTWDDVGQLLGVTTAQVAIVSDASADADTETSTQKITMTGHGFQTGDAAYYVSSATNVITGLTDDTIYYIIDFDSNTVKVATTRANAIAGTPITLTQPAGGDTHYFTKSTNELALNIENSTDEAVLPLWPKARVVVTTGTSDIFTVSEVWVSRRL